MHLLMAAVEGENIWMVATTFFVTHVAGDMHIGPSPIVETVHSPGLIGYTGSAPAGYGLIREASNLPTSDNVFHFLINAHVENQELSFVYATYANGRPALIEIIGGVYTVTPAACVGSETPVAEFRKYLDSDSHPAESDYFFTLEAPEDPRGNFSRMARGIFLVAQSMNTATVEGSIAPYFLSPEGSRLCPYVSASLGPVPDMSPSEAPKPSKPSSAFSRAKSWLTKRN